MSDKTPIIYWLRQDLRLGDNQALTKAAARGPVIPVFIWDNTVKPVQGGASKWWLEQNLKALEKSFHSLGAPLILRQGRAEKVLTELVKETGAKTLTWCRGYEPELIASDQKLAAHFRKAGMTIDIEHGFLLHEPETIKNGSDKPYRVYTPFSKACRATASIAQPLPAPKKLEGVKGIKSDQLEDLHLVPHSAKWPKGLAATWDVSENAAHERLHTFIDEMLGHYATARNLPDRDGTSRLSPYLHFGLLSPRQVWHAIDSKRHGSAAHSASAERYLLEILWREFSWHLIFHFPDMEQKPLDPAFTNFPWRTDAKGLEAWQIGMTGFPIVDAGMRQLWQTGWMHNRVRMIVASFLIKHLLLDWRTGMNWFWDTLVDADLGNNTASWQWVAGCGADAAPYFRIFNPMLQGKKFDVNGDYVRKFVPELAKLETEYIHEPWLAPTDSLEKAGIKLGKTYPLPIVEHDKARKRALAALAQSKHKDPQEAGSKDLFS